MVSDKGLKWLDFFFFSLSLADIDKNGKVDAKEMEQIVTVCLDEKLFEERKMGFGFF